MSAGNATENAQGTVMNDITNEPDNLTDYQQRNMKRNTSLLFESIPEGLVYNPNEANDENSPYPLKSSLSVKRSLTSEPNDKKVCFENSPMVLEYDKLSSEDEYSLRNSNSQQSVDSNGSSRIATNFQLNWKPNLSDKTPSTNTNAAAVKHSLRPKPLPPMPSNLPQSDSLQQDLHFFNSSQDPSSSGQFTGLLDSPVKDFDNHGNTSEVYSMQAIEIPKLRTKKPPRYYEPENTTSSEQETSAMDLDEKLEGLNINESVNYNKNDFSIGDYLESSNSSVNKFNFTLSSLNSPSKLEQRKQMSAMHFEDTLDSVLPPDRTPSTIIKENNKLYNKYRTDSRVASNNSESYYEDVVLDSVRQNVNSKFSLNRDSVKRFVKIPKQGEESLNNIPESTKDEFSIGDYLNNSRDASRITNDNNVSEEVTDPTISSHSVHKESFTTNEKHQNPSRLSSLGSSVPLGESTMDHSGIFSSTPVNGYTPQQKRYESLDEMLHPEHEVSENIVEDETCLHPAIENTNIMYEQEEKLVEEHIERKSKAKSEVEQEIEQEIEPVVADEIEPELELSNNSYNQLREQDVSIRQDDSDAFKPFSESVLFEQQNSKGNNTSDMVDISNDSAGSNFTLRLMQMKKEKERALVSQIENQMIARHENEHVSAPNSSNNKRSRDDMAGDNSVIDNSMLDNSTLNPKSLAPTRLTNSVLNTLLSKTNEYAAKSGISFPNNQSVNTSANTSTDTKVKIFSNKHSFDKPNKQIFDKPNFPRSTTQDSLSSSEEVHNIWANINSTKEPKNTNDRHQKATTIRSQSMKSSPSMNSVDIKKMLKAKRKISQTGSSRANSRKYAAPAAIPRMIDDSFNADNSSLGNNRLGGNFIDDTIDRGSSGGEDINIDDDDDEYGIEDEGAGRINNEEEEEKEEEEEEERNNDEEANEGEEVNGDDSVMLDHIANELSKIPQPLLPEQHFDKFSDLEQELTEEFSRFEDDRRGYTTRNANELIVAKLDNMNHDYDEEDSNAVVFDKDEKKMFVKDHGARNSGKEKITPNEIFNSKKPHIYKGIVKRPRETEVRASSNNQTYSRARKTSGGGGAMSYASARNSMASKDANVRKRKSGALKERTSARNEAQRVPSGNGPARISFDSSYHTASIYERQISAPKSHRLSTATKRGQSLRGSIHDASSFTTSGTNEKDKYLLEQDQHYYRPHPEPIFEDDNNFLDINLPKDDQGRLYVRIVGLKNLDLPAIENHNAKFSLILDNGIHCISTPEVALDTNTSINQEFELTVSDNLEFILTLKASYLYEGQEKLVEVTEKYPVRKRVLGGLLGHKTIYKTRQRLVTKVDKNDPWDNKTAKDGSFARAYVDFAQYEPLITGKACNFDVTCFNEWETFVENNQVKKRQPYRIGKLELQMLYIPRTKVNEVFPPSIHIAYEAVKEYQKQLLVQYEGYLSQEGGDCNYLKRRWFTLNGTDLVAHNEFSKKTRAKINLIKAVGLISSNIKKHYHLNPSQVAGRRLSDEILMHQGFKIKFMNGEIIEFVADSQSEKINWLKVLDQVIGRNKYRQAWTKILYDQLS